MELYVVTSDRDLGDDKPFPGITTNSWIDGGKCRILYCSPGFLNAKRIKVIFNSISPDWIYLNSMFSFRLSILPLFVNRFGMAKPVMLAPRGMLQSSALRFKSIKKKTYLNLASAFRLFDNAIFQATSVDEMAAIEKNFGKQHKKILLRPLLPEQNRFVPIIDKNKGELNMLFVGRVHPIKNLLFLIKLLIELPEYMIRLTIVGQIEDLDYWQQCSSLLTQSNVQVTMHESITHSKIDAVITSCHLLALPTTGENFGHAVFEALAAGRPVLISDQTPWRNLLEESAGYDIDLKDRSAFKQAIKAFALMDNDEINVWAKGAWDFCFRFIQSSAIDKMEYNRLFNG